MSAYAAMTPAMYALAAIADAERNANQTAGATTRDRIAAQDHVLAAIIARVKGIDDSAPAKRGEITPAVAAEIRAIGASLAAKWGVKHADLPDTRRSAQ